MKRIKRIFCLALVCAMLLSLTACGGSAHTAPQRETSYDLSVSFDRAEEKDELTKISDNGRFTLYANLHDGTAAVKDGADRPDLVHQPGGPPFRRTGQRLQ